MQSYLEYQQLLSNSIAQQTQGFNEKKEKFEKDLAISDAEKSGIERGTDAVGGIFMVKPTEAFSKITGRLIKKGLQKVGVVAEDKAKQFGQKALDTAKEKLNRLTGQNNDEGTPEVEPTETDNTVPFEADPDVAPSGAGTSDLYSLREISNDPELWKNYAKQTFPEESENQTDEQFEEARQQFLDQDLPDDVMDNMEFVSQPESALRDSLAPMRDEMMQRQQTREAQQSDEMQEGEQEGTSVGDAEGSGQEAVVNSAGTEASSVDATANAVGDAVGDAVGGGLSTEVPDIAASIFADLDPFTAIFGLIFGIGSLIGGIEGANSVKTPPVPKPPPMVQSSVQFGL